MRPAWACGIVGDLLVDEFSISEPVQFDPADRAVLRRFMFSDDIAELAHLLVGVYEVLSVERRLPTVGQLRAERLAAGQSADDLPAQSRKFSSIDGVRMLADFIADRGGCELHHGEGSDCYRLMSVVWPYVSGPDAPEHMRGLKFAWALREACAETYSPDGWV